jgi:hypothetical protein
VTREVAELTMADVITDELELELGVLLIDSGDGVEVSDGTVEELIVAPSVAK